MRMSMRGARDLILLICVVISTQVCRVYLVRATAGYLDGPGVAHGSQRPDCVAVCAVLCEPVSPVLP